VTDAGDAEIASIERELGDPGTNPMAVKKRLAARIVRMFHGAEAAERAEQDFVQQFSRREVPDDIPAFYGDQVRGAMKAGLVKPIVIDFVVASGMAESRSAARRLVEQKAVRVDEGLVESWDREVDPEQAHVLRVGRKIMRYKPQAD
jgi:tyrosyl-tRNA synthetase